jgi:hypothetical protein
VSIDRERYRDHHRRPETWEFALPVVAQTTHGISDDNVTIIGTAASRAGAHGPGGARTPAAAVVMEPES